MSSRFSLEAILTLTDNMTSQFKKATTQTVAISQRTQQQITQMNQGVNRMIRGAVVGIGVAATAAGGGIAYLVNEASKIEDATARFTPLMGSVEKANDLVKALNETAATTPFQFENIADVANSILPAMNGDIEKTIETFRMLGDTAGGNATRLNAVSSVFTRAVLKNKVEVGDLNMLVSNGIPIYGELAKTMGVTVEEMASMVSQGKVTGKVMEQTFQNMTKEGGIFYNGMQIASETLTGKISTMKDNIALTAATIGQAFLPSIKKGTDGVIELLGRLRSWVETNKELINQKVNDFMDNMSRTFKEMKPYVITFMKSIGELVRLFIKWAPVLKKVLVLFGLYTAAVKIFMAAQLVMNIMKAVQAFAALAKAQGILNALMYANPAGLIVLGIMALIAVIAIAIKNYEEFGSLLLRSLGPIGMLVDQIMFIKTAWNEVKAAFRDEGFWGGMAEIFKQWFEWLVKPIKEVWNMIQQIGQAMGGEGRDARITRREERQTERQDQRQERRQEAMLATQANAVRQERIVEEQNQRYDLYLHAPAAGYAMSQAGQAPSQAIQLGRQ